MEPNNACVGVASAQGALGASPRVPST